MNIISDCPSDVLSKLREALQSLPNPDKVAAAICEATRQQSREVQTLSYGLNQLYLLFGTALVFVMHGGFAMLAAGAIRSKNAVNILLQTLMDACVSALMWYILGFGFAYGIGDKPNVFIGDAMFALARMKSHDTGSGFTGRWLDIVFEWAFCATAVTIPAGSVAERCNFNAYLCYSTFISAFLYPVVAHWVWCSKGWLGYGTLKPLLQCGMMDFAGSAVVHMLGGLSGLAGAVLVGPRMGRFDLDNQPLPLPGHSAVLVVLGTVLLWFGWYGFNPVSTLIIDTVAAAEVASRSAVTTTLAGAAGGVGSLAWTLLRTRTFDLHALCNGVLCGFVAVTAGCHVYEPWAAILCGAGAGVIFDLACILLLKLKVDDPLGAAPMHGCCGAFGVLFVGLLAKKEYVLQSYKRPSYPYGLFYGGGGRLLACQAIGVLVIAGWTLGLMFPFFWILKSLNLLRVAPEEELDGLDISRHYSRAYNMDHYPEQLLVTPIVTYTNSGGTVITAIKKDGGTVGDAIMRAELIGSSGSKAAWMAPLVQQQQKEAFEVRRAQYGSASMGQNVAAAGLAPKVSMCVDSSQVQEQDRMGLSPVEPLNPPFGLTPLEKSLPMGGPRTPSRTSSTAGLPLVQSQPPQQPPQLPGALGVQNNSDRGISVTAQQQKSMQQRLGAIELQKGMGFDSSGLQQSAASVVADDEVACITAQLQLGKRSTEQQLAGTLFIKPAKSMQLQGNDKDMGSGELQSEGAERKDAPGSYCSSRSATAARMMPASRSVKQVTAAPHGDALGVSGTFEEGADISVHRLTT